MKKPLIAAEVADMMGIAKATLQYNLYRHPEKVPRSFVVPGTRTRLWHPQTVIEFLEGHAAKQGAMPTESQPQKARK